MAQQTGDQRETSVFFQCLLVLVLCFYCVLLCNCLVAWIKCHSAFSICNFFLQISTDP